jgi:hypothetical protein
LRQDDRRDLDRRTGFAGDYRIGRKGLDRINRINRI